MKLLLLLTLFSCASALKDEGPWIGHSITEVQSHPYFSKLEVKRREKKGKDIYVYQDPAPYRTSAQCQALGGCLGLPDQSCEHLFFVEDGKIVAVDQHGNCPTYKPAP